MRIITPPKTPISMLNMLSESFARVRTNHRFVDPTIINRSA